MAALTATTGFVKAKTAMTGLTMSLGAAGAKTLQMRSAMAVVTSGVLALVPILHTAGKATLQFASSLTSLVGVMTVPTIAAAGTAFASVAIAIKGMGDAIGASDAEGLQDALNQLTPSAQTAALSIRDLRDQFDFSGIQEAFFEPLGNLGQVSALIEPLNEVMRTLAGNLGLAASGLVEFLTTGTGLTAMTELLNGTKFAASDLAGGLRNVLKRTVVLGAAAPTFSRMMSHFLGLAETWKNNPITAFEDGSLQRPLAEKEAAVVSFWKSLSPSRRANRRDLFRYRQGRRISEYKWWVQLPKLLIAGQRVVELDAGATNPAKLLRLSSRSFVLHIADYLYIGLHRDESDISGFC